MKCKFIYGNRYFQLEYLKFWPDENKGFAFISDRYTIAFTAQVYETEIQTQLRNVNFFMETGISNWHIWKCLPYENAGFAFISHRYTTNFTEPLYETDI